MSERVRSFAGLRQVVLIGGGDLMLHAARAVVERGLGCAVIMAPRHAEENLPLDGRVAHLAFASLGVPALVVDDMGREDRWRTTVAPAGALALCFGPAWIFPARVREVFDLGMLNFNGIPVPRYLGGAHYTWQILNGDRSGGCILQEITAAVDRGPIIRLELFELPSTVRVPLDYFAANTERARAFIDRALADMADGVEFPIRAFSALEAERLYFPRLLTRENGLVDWSWGATDIERFCAAFDQPYPGAGTSLSERPVRLRDVSRVAVETAFHPFAAGLVVRVHAGVAHVAVRDGLLRLGRVLDEATGEDIGASVAEGSRFHTPQAQLEAARLFRPRLGGGGRGRRAVS